MTLRKTTLGVLLVPTVLLLVPLVAMQFSDEMTWSVFDFVVAWILMAGAGVAYQLATRRAANLAYRAGVALAVATGFLLTWINLAVGVIGTENNPANLLYAGVLAIGVIGAVLARFRPQGMAQALFATAAAQALVPFVALLIWQPPVHPGVLGVFVLNGGFVLLFAGAGFLFRHAARSRHERARETLA